MYYACLARGWASCVNLEEALAPEIARQPRVSPSFLCRVPAVVLLSGLDVLKEGGLRCTLWYVLVYPVGM